MDATKGCRRSSRRSGGGKLMETIGSALNMSDPVLDNYLRQMDVIQPKDIPQVTVIGGGAAGSGIGIILSKLGAKRIELFDGDDVDIHNVPNQYFAGNSVGHNKARELKSEIERIAPVTMKPIVSSREEFFGESSQAMGKIVFLCVDGLDNRREVFNLLRSQNHIQWVIDSRMASQYYELHTVNMYDEVECEAYLATLEGEPRDSPCTDRSVIYTVMRMASDAVRFMKKIIKEQPVPKLYAEDLDNDLRSIYTEWRDGESPKERLRRLAE